MPSSCFNSSPESDKGKHRLLSLQCPQLTFKSWIFAGSAGDVSSSCVANVFVPGEKQSFVENNSEEDLSHHSPGTITLRRHKNVRLPVRAALYSRASRQAG
jgi:hypothetical protein